MNESGAVVGQGFALAYTGFVDWYTNVFTPGVKEERAIIKVAQWVFEQSAEDPRRAPGCGEGDQAGHRRLRGRVQERRHQEQAGSPDRQLPGGAECGAGGGADPPASRSREQFETSRPSDFEAAMFAHLNEEVATPGIHAASDFGMGKTTRKKLAQLGDSRNRANEAHA